jgi:hypothetical protein
MIPLIMNVTRDSYAKIRPNRTMRMGLNMHHTAVLHMILKWLIWLLGWLNKVVVRKQTRRQKSYRTLPYSVKFDYLPLLLSAHQHVTDRCGSRWPASIMKEECSRLRWQVTILSLEEIEGVPVHDNVQATQLTWHIQTTVPRRYENMYSIQWPR